LRSVFQQGASLQHRADQGLSLVLLEVVGQDRVRVDQVGGDLARCHGLVGQHHADLHVAGGHRDGDPRSSLLGARCHFGRDAGLAGSQVARRQKGRKQRKADRGQQHHPGSVDAQGGKFETHGLYSSNV
jgi:hypothetical protein